MATREQDQPTPVVRGRLVGGPFNSAAISTSLVNGHFMFAHVRVINSTHAALYLPPLEFDASTIVEFAFEGTVTWDDTRGG